MVTDDSRGADPMDPSPPVVSDTRRAVTTITMSSAALDAATKAALLGAISAAATDDTVRAIVLTGRGRVFCAGQHLGEHAAALSVGPGVAFETLDEHYAPLVTALHDAPKPVVAAINGTCVGAGLSLALACDLRVSADTAKFATAFTGIGLSFDSALSATLSRAVGTARASELILRGDAFTAEQALQWGLVGEVVPADDLAATAARLAERLAAGPTLAYAAAKRAISASWSAAWADVLDHENAAQRRLGATADHQRAVAAFLAKERPVFEGR